ncbi:hypothetical protein [Actinomycetospora termitidis]|uniref:Uncharacterized protein n=1 Tax=Actinomycetospora termitidis TaxID=3053470 RepID=A0ABT7MFJ2_9PSEU|nr:hypothetical protein [Actinomycetospora sp. Odt1-22]MDL5159436.1 hypothetical protein [Actinomycetospora sp. Odt1-22]
MSKTTEGVGLAVPDKAVTALERHYDDVHRDLADLSGMMRETDDYVRAIAAPVVAAELRSWAEDVENQCWSMQSLPTVLRRRAAELDVTP